MWNCIHIKRRWQKERVNDNWWVVNIWWLHPVGPRIFGFRPTNTKQWIIDHWNMTARVVQLKTWTHVSLYCWTITCNNRSMKIETFQNSDSNLTRSFTKFQKNGRQDWFALRRIKSGHRPNREPNPLGRNVGSYRRKSNHVINAPFFVCWVGPCKMGPAHC